MTDAMNNRDFLKTWLGDRQRKFADGVSLFRALGRPQTKVRYLSFIESGLSEGSMNIFDPRFTMLINLLDAIDHDIPVQPLLYPAAQDVFVSSRKSDGISTENHGNLTETVEKSTRPVKKTTKFVDNTTKSPENRTVPSVSQERVDDLEDRVADAEDEISDLDDKVREHDDAIDEMQSQIDELSKPGVKVVTEGDMPSALRKDYARLKEIVPLYASLHADICREDVTDDMRKGFASRLIKLDDERRRIWKKIDDWSQGKDVSLEVDRPQYSDVPVVRGFELARAVKRLKENIRNSESAAKKAKEDGRQVVYDNAMRRIEGYRKELKEIEDEINGGQPA